MDDGSARRSGLDDRLAAEWESHRPAVFGVAYRLLGSVADAEDVAQDVWLRAAGADLGAVDDLRAWLVTVAARRSYDLLKSARVRRESICSTIELRGLSRLETGELLARVGVSHLTPADLTRVHRLSGGNPLYVEAMARSMAFTGMVPTEADSAMLDLPYEVRGAVARVVEHALTAATPRTRYLVGRDARLRAALTKLVPDRLRDRLVTRALKLPPRG